MSADADFRDYCDEPDCEDCYPPPAPVRATPELSVSDESRQKARNLIEDFAQACHRRFVTGYAPNEFEWRKAGRGKDEARMALMDFIVGIASELSEATRIVDAARKLVHQKFDKRPAGGWTNVGRDAYLNLEKSVLAVSGTPENTK